MKYDLHIHSRFSKCSNMDPEKIIHIAKKNGLDGIAITDHNTIQGGLAGKEIDPNFVIVGAELDTDHGEIIGLFLTKDIKTRKFFEVIDEIHAQGGLAILAHPTARFRRSQKHPCIELDKRIDAYETFNARALLFENSKADHIASKHRYPKIGGSDAHFYYEIGRGYTEFENDLIKALKERKTTTSGSTLLAIFGLMYSSVRRLLFK